MEIIFLKSSACLVVLLSFYKLFLEHESFHRFKRIYLLTVILIAIIIPNITFIQYLEVNSITSNIIAHTTQENNVANQDWSSFILPTLRYIYYIGVLLFGIRFIVNLCRLFIKIKTNPKTKQLYFINVLLSDTITPHTFFNYIFLNKKRFETNQIPKEVLLHEQAHAKQKHSLDIIFIELIQVVFWFNPLVYILKHYIKLNHEFLADQAVLTQGIDSNNYKHTLLAFSSNAFQSQLANAINYSLIKKRFTVMKTQTSKPLALVKSLLLLPLLAILIYSFSSRSIVEKQSPKNNTIVIDEQQKATPKQVAEYNKLAKHYNSLDKSNMRIKMKDVERLKYLYSLMSEAQRKSAEPFPDFPEPPPVPKEPEVVKYRKAERVPPPPIPSNATAAQKAKYKKIHAEYAKKYKVSKRTVGENIPPPPPKVDKAERVPPPPPPLDMEKLAKENAEFYYEGKKVSAKEAIKIYNANKDLNVQVRDYGSKRPVVKISKEPIRLRKEH